jgi:hypothetical protein
MADCVERFIDSPVSTGPDLDQLKLFHYFIAAVLDGVDTEQEPIL